MIQWFMNPIYECCFGNNKKIKFMVADHVEELSQHEIEQLRQLLKPSSTNNISDLTTGLV